MVHSGTTSNLKPRLQLSSFSRHPSGTGLRFDEVRIDRNPDEPGFTAGRPNSIRLIQLIFVSLRNAILQAPGASLHFCAPVDLQLSPVQTAFTNSRIAANRGR